MDNRNIECIPKCLAVAFKHKFNSFATISGDDLFKNFIDINNYCYWNINLKEIFDKCELVGHVNPYCLLISAPDLFIQSLKLAHQKRLLKPPESFAIIYLGDVDSVSCNSVIPSPFVSLDEALCYVIFDLNIRNEISIYDAICCRLAEWYPDLQLPPQCLILATLRNLMDAGQIYYTGYGYNVMTLDKICVAQWLGDQGPEDSVPTTINSLNDVSVVDKSDIHPSNKSDRIVHRKASKLPDPLPIIRNSHSSMAIMTPPEDTVKITKARSAVKLFFDKFRSRRHKSHASSFGSTIHNSTSLYDCDSNNLSLNMKQPKFYSSNMEFSSPFSINNRQHCVPFQDTTSKLPCSWRTSLQSLPASGTDATLRRSSSSNSRMSRQVIRDQSPPQKSVTKARYCRRKSKEKLSSIEIRFPEINEQIQDDSGVHSVSETHSKSPSKEDNSCGLGRHKSMDIGQMTAPSMRQQKIRSHHRLSRSISSRLSSLSITNNLHPVGEVSRSDGRDNKHVVFQDSSVIRL